ncbi:uracil-DNA glycosylase family protein [Pseudonocardia aurantiaca]
MLVGEQPGDKEDIAGKPFVGPAGRVLDTLLERAGIARASAPAAPGWTASLPRCGRTRWRPSAPSPPKTLLGPKFRLHEPAGADARLGGPPAGGDLHPSAILRGPV